MVEGVRGELRLFLISVITGITTGILFDLFRAIRKTNTGGDGAVWAEDIIFWICETALIFSVIYRYNSGQVRFYFFIGLVSGTVLYLLTVSPAVIFIFGKITVFLKSVLLFPVRILKSIYRLFAMPVRVVTEKVKKTARKLKKRLKMY